MYELTQLKVENLFSFKDINIDFKKGASILEGINNDESGLASNGSGKSSIFNSICWVLYGTVFDKRENDEIIRLGEDSCTGYLKLNDIEIIRKQTKTTKTVELRINGENKTCSTNTETQNKINEVLGCDYKTFLNSHYMSSDFSKAFIGKDTKPKERFEVFERFLDLELLNKCIEYSKNKVSEFKDVINIKKDRISELKNSIEEADENKILSGIEEFKTKLFKLDKDIQLSETELNLLEQQKRDYNNYIKSKTKIDEITQLEENLKKFNNDLKPYNIEIDKLEIILNDISNSIKHIDSFLNKKYYTCPKCESKLLLSDNQLKLPEDFNEEALTKEKERLTLDLNKKQNDLSNYKDLHNQYLKNIREKENLEHEISIRKDSLEIKNEVSPVDNEEYLSLKVKLNDFQSNRNRYNIEIGSLNKTLETLKENKSKIKEYEKELKEKESLFDKYSFWVKGFTEIKTSRIDSIIPLFESETNNILSSKFDFGATINFNTRRELKSGKEKIELNVTVKDSSGIERSFESLSQGEKGRFAIAVTFARKNILGDQSLINFILIDELLDGLDEEGQISLINFIKESDYQILNISHSNNFKNEFNNKIYVEKTNGISKCYYRD